MQTIEYLTATVELPEGATITLEIPGEETLDMTKQAAAMLHIGNGLTSLDDDVEDPSRTVEFGTLTSPDGAGYRINGEPISSEDALARIAAATIEALRAFMHENRNARSGQENDSDGTPKPEVHDS